MSEDDKIFQPTLFRKLRNFQNITTGKFSYNRTAEYQLPGEKSHLVSLLHTKKSWGGGGDILALWVMKLDKNEGPLSPQNP